MTSIIPRPAQAQPSKRKVLIVDDSETARAAIGDTLLGLGYEVLELASAIGATRTILRNEINAVILDVSMPGLSGDKLVGLLRENAKLGELVIILVSANESGELERLPRAFGADAVLPKGLVHTKLGPLLERLLADAQRRAMRAKARS